MSDPNTPNDDASQAAASAAGDNAPAGDAQPTTPLNPAPAGPDTQDLRATTPQPQAPAAPQAPWQQAPAAPQAPQAPAAPQQQFQPGAPQAPFQPGAPQQFQPGPPQAPGAPSGPGAPQAPGVPSYGYNMPPRQPKGLAITALVLGIVAVVGALIFGWIPFVGGVMTILVGIAAVILGFIALNKRQSKGMALTGLIAGVVGVLIGIGIVIAWSVFFANVNQSIDDYSSSLDELQSELEDFESYDYSTEDSSSGSSDVDVLEYSASFCAVFDEYSALNPSGDLQSDSPEALEIFKRLAAEDSPNQDAYARFYEIISDPANASSYSYDEVSEATQDLVSAMMEDTAGCM